ncbi:MAG: hypothetical protein ACOH5I_18155 [Oligoflexus sp.]
MDDVVLTREEMAKKIVGLRDIRFEIEELKLRAKNAEEDQNPEFQEHLAEVEHNYDLYKEKLTQYAVSDDEELKTIKSSLDQVWKNLQASVQKFADFSKH